jgi:hypothetical protein
VSGVLFQAGSFDIYVWYGRGLRAVKTMLG